MIVCGIFRNVPNHYFSAKIVVYIGRLKQERGIVRTRVASVPRFSEIKSFSFFLCNCGGGCLWRTIIRTGTDMDVHCSHSAFLTDCTSRLHSAVIQCLSVHRVDFLEMYQNTVSEPKMSFRTIIERFSFFFLLLPILRRKFLRLSKREEPRGNAILYGTSI